MIAVCSAFLFVLVCCLTTILMHHTSESLVEKIYKSNLNSLKTMQVYCDTNVLYQANEVILAMQMKSEGKSKVHSFINSGASINEKAVFDIYTELNSLILGKEAIESVEVYNRVNQIAISSGSGVSYLNGKANPYEELFDNEHSSVWTQAEDGYIKIISTFPYYSKNSNKESCGIIKINASRLMQSLETLKGKENDIEFCITDKDMKLLVSTAGEDFKVNFPKNIAAQEMNKVFVDDEKHQTFYVDSNGGEWKYFYIIPPSLYEKELAAIRAVSFWNAFFVSFFGLFVLVLISLWLYKPIKKMAQLLGRSRGEKVSLFDVSFINDEINNLLLRVDEVNRVVEKKLPLIRSQLFLEAIYGIIEWKGFCERLAAVEANFEVKKLVPCIISLNDNMFKRIDLKEQNFILYKICELFENVETEDCRCLTTKISDFNIALLVNFTDSNQDEDCFFESVRRDICEFGIDKFNLIVGSGAGADEDISLAFRKMIELRKYSFVYGWSNILKLSELIARETKFGENSPQKLSENLERLFLGEDFDSAYRFLNSFYIKCGEEKYACDYIEKCLVSFMQVAARTVRSGKNRSEEKIDGDKLDNMHYIFDYLMRMIQNPYCKEETYTAPEIKLIEKVKRYIRDNIEGDVSQISVSREFDVSAEHLSRTFKRVCGENFSDFVVGTKLEVAARKLCENENMTVKKIAESVGYNNMNYFTMLFKKKYFMTPSQYRKTKQAAK